MNSRRFTPNHLLFSCLCTLALPAHAGLVSYWSFDDETANDLVGGNNAEAIVDAGFSTDTPGGNGMSLDLSGDDYVKLPDTDFGIGDTNTFTISAWLKLQSSQRGVISIMHDLTSGGGDRSGITFGVSPDDAFFVGIIASTGDEVGDEANGGGTFRDIVSDQTIPTGQWVHMAATLDSNDRLTTYVNGVPAEVYISNPAVIDEDGGNITDGLGIDLVDTDGSFTGFGASGNGPESGDSLGDFTRLFYEGLLDEVAIWDTALDIGAVKLLANGTAPTDLDPGDTDGDGLPDTYENQFEFLDPNDGTDAAKDQDGDTLSNLAEFNGGTAPDRKDTDDDGLDDNAETGTGTFVDATNTGTNPRIADTDGDGVDDGAETNSGTFVDASNRGTDPHNPDTDGDRLLDGVETNTMVFVDESNTGTDPTKADTDGDDVSDFVEVSRGSDPFDPASVPEEQEGGLVSYWSFDDGETVTDLVGSNNGSVLNRIAFSDDTPTGGGKALDLSKADDYVRIGPPSPDAPDFGIGETDSFTISAWVKYEASQRGVVTIKQDLTSGGGDRSGVTFGINDGGLFFIGIIASTGDDTADEANGGGTFRDITTDQEIPTGEWVHMAATLVDDTLITYVNGEPAEDYSVNPGGAIEPDGTNITGGEGIDFIDSDGSFTGFGASGNGPEHGDSAGDFTRLFYDGLLDEVAIWNIAIAEEDVKRLADGATPLDIAQPIPFRITDVLLDPVSRSLDLTWNSKSGAVYTLEESADLKLWLEVDDGIESEGDATSVTLEGISGDVQERYYRIMEQ